MYWGLGNYPLRRSFAESGSALFTLGFERPSDLPTEVLMFTEAAVGLGLLALTTDGHIERQNLTMRMGMRRFTTRLPPPWLRGSRTTSGRCGRSRPFSTENRPCYARVPWTGSRCSASLP